MKIIEKSDFQTVWILWEKWQKDTERTREGHGKFIQKPHPLGEATSNPQGTQTTPRHYSTAIIFSFSF